MARRAAELTASLFLSTQCGKTEEAAETKHDGEGKAHVALQMGAEVPLTQSMHTSKAHAKHIKLRSVTSVRTVHGSRAWANEERRTGK